MMKRIIKDFKSTPSEILSLISTQYPFGYDESHLVNFINSKGEYFHALEIKTPDSVYLIKQDRNLDQHINEFLDSDSDSEQLEKNIGDLGEADFDDESED